MTAAQRSGLSGRADLIATVIISCLLLVVVWQALGRQYLNVDTETDFISGFHQEAGRILRGEPLLMEFHPPGYAVTLAAVFSLVGDWFVAGLLVSVVSALVVLLTSYLCFRELLSGTAGLGALAALAGSAVFVSFSVQATSDMYFLALWCAAIWLIVVNMRRQRSGLWFAAGVLIGGAVLARTNGVVLLALILAPLVATRPSAAGVRGLLVLIAGIAAPIIAWSVYAKSTGSPFMPTKTYANLALTYFADGSRISADSLVPLQSQFSSSLDVLLSDPMRVMRIYAKDLWHLPNKLLSRLTWPPLAALSVVCSVAWITRLRDPRVLLVLGVSLASVALLNMKAFEARYFMLLLPVAGAGIGLAASWLAARASQAERAGGVVTAGLGLLVAAVFGVAGSGGFARAENRVLSAEFGEIIGQIERLTPEDARIVCRKCNAAYHAGRTTAGFFPEVRDLRELCGYLKSLDPAHPTYITIATMERRLRPEISAELSRSSLPDWLVLTAEGSGPAPWRLIEYKSAVECRR